MLEIDLPRMESLSPQHDPPSPIQPLETPQPQLQPQPPSFSATKCGCKYINTVSKTFKFL